MEIEMTTMDSRRPLVDDDIYDSVPPAVAFIEIPNPQPSWKEKLQAMPRELLFLCCFSVVPLSGFFVSIFQYNACPLMPFLPKYLIIHGIVFFVMMAIKTKRYITEDKSFSMAIVEGLATTLELAVLCDSFNRCVWIFIVHPSGDNRRRPEEKNMQCDECIWYIVLITAVLFALFLVVFITVMTCSACCIHVCCSGEVEEKETKSRSSTGKSKKNEESVAFVV